MTKPTIEERQRRHERRNVAGLMPHPERACEPLLGSDDGKWIFESIFAALKNKTVAQAA
jgi:phosphoribosylformylglycinamidine synthase